MTTAQKAFFAIIASSIIWGAAAPVFKVSLTNIPPFTLAFWRFFLGSVFLTIYLGKNAALPTKTLKDLILLIQYAFFGITMNIIFFFLGLRLTHAINAPIIASGQSIFIYLMALFFLHESFSLRKLLGMTIGTAGIIIIVIEPFLTSGRSGSFLGNLFLFIATFSAVLMTIIGKRILGRVNPLPFTLWAFIFGTASFLPLAINEYMSIPHLYQALDIRGYMGIIYGSVFSSAASYALFAWGLSKINVSDVTVFSYIDPVIGTVLSAVFLKEPITAYFIIGGIFIFSGIYLAEGKLHYRRFKDIQWVHELHDSVTSVEHTVEHEIQEERNVMVRNKRAILTAIFGKNDNRSAGQKK